ncbi:MAG TPA: MotA/TolQ/ExbB proton channel family protein [Planctomycetaceae bacterium]|nr:MotA/TolQ/ExbB proton channel family protein [Planctomycetaceae bacterium]
MQSLSFANYLEDSTYAFLALNALLGVYFVIVVWRRTSQLRFRSDESEEKFITEFNSLVSAHDYESAMKLCDYDFRALPRLCMIILGNRDSSYRQIRQVAADSMQRHIVADLEHRLSWIATVIKSGPLLGLFGTVLGMMAAFARIGTGEKVQPSQIAEEISIALICTAMGLATAIPLGYILSNLTIRVRRLQESLGAGLARVLEPFREVES